MEARSKHKILTAIIMLIAAMSAAFTVAACQPAAKDPKTADVKADYVITKVKGDINWEDIPAFDIDQVLWTDDYGIRAKGQLCYDKDNLYVHLSAKEKDIRAENTEPLTPVYEDSCLEFFFMLEGEEKYFNFETNPNGVLNKQVGITKTDRISLVREDDKEYFDIRTDRTSEGWEVYYKIPLEFMKVFYPDYEYSGVLLANAYKCGNKTVNKHYLSWKPVNSEKPNFHVTSSFGRMSFEDP